jgi:zinc transport system substrate-binding protein
MKKIIFLVFVFLLVLGGLFWSGKKSSVVESKDRVRVVTSGYVPYTLVKQIGGEHINLSMLLPVNAEPHSFEPTPGAIVTVDRADIFVYISDRLEPWAKDVLADKRDKALRLADVATPSEDPHVWMDFNNIHEMAKLLAETLSEKDPKNQSLYEENLKEFLTELDSLHQSYQEVLSTCQSREVVHIGHLAFKNLTKNYHLSLAALAGSSHDGEHSVHKLAELIKLIQEKNVKAIFTEETLSPRLSATVAEETGAQVLPLYTVEHISKEDFELQVTYGELMRRNLQSLKRGLACQ